MADHASGVSPSLNQDRTPKTDIVLGLPVPIAHFRFEVAGDVTKEQLASARRRHCAENYNEHIAQSLPEPVAALPVEVEASEARQRRVVRKPMLNDTYQVWSEECKKWINDGVIIDRALEDLWVGRSNLKVRQGSVKVWYDKGNRVKWVPLDKVDTTLKENTEAGERFPRGAFGDLAIKFGRSGLPIRMYAELHGGWFQWWPAEAYAAAGLSPLGWMEVKNLPAKFDWTKSPFECSLRCDPNAITLEHTQMDFGFVQSKDFDIETMRWWRDALRSQVKDFEEVGREPNRATGVSQLKLTKPESLLPLMLLHDQSGQLKSTQIDAEDGTTKSPAESLAHNLPEDDIIRACFEDYYARVERELRLTEKRLKAEKSRVDKKRLTVKNCRLER